MGLQWVYNGSTMGLQWVYNDTTMGLQHIETGSGQLRNSERTSNAIQPYSNANAQRGRQRATAQAG
eukprot:1632299-Heterocapsa_arctica.AAC.1